MTEHTQTAEGVTLQTYCLICNLPRTVLCRECRERHQQRQRRKDKAWLLWDLRERRRQSLLDIPQKSGLMRDVAWHGVDRFDRLIALVRDIDAKRWVKDE